MKVVIEKSLFNVIQYLESTNKYEVEIYGEYIGPTDALIYESSMNQEQFSDFQFDIRNVSLQNHLGQEKGILVINSRHKTPKEIEQLLDTRLYNTVF